MPPRDNVPVTQLYKKLEAVGKGSYGSVHRGIEIATGNVVALKIINLDTEDDDVDDIQREVTLLSHLRGAERNNVTVYYGCYLEGPHVWIVMDFASGGSVRTLMKATKNNVIEERFAVVITRETLIALTFLHKSGVIHRDVKAANILITHTGRVVLCDFGVSALLSTTHSKRTTFVGTPHWMAPEVISSGSLYDAKADIWSLGVTIYEMITGGPPHGDQLNLRAIALIPKSKPPRLPDAIGSKEMKEFVSNCLRELPGERPSAEELSKSKWIKSSSKAPVSYLRELLKIYDDWTAQGGVRSSLAGDPNVEDETEMNGHYSDGDWEFDTVRGRFENEHEEAYHDPPNDALEEATDMLHNLPEFPPRGSPVQVPVAQAPRSLRLWADENSHSGQVDLTGSLQSVSPFLLADASSVNDTIETPTPRQSAWASPSAQPSRAPSPERPRASSPIDSPTKPSSFRDVRTYRALNISIPPTSPASVKNVLHSDHDGDEDTERSIFSSSPESERSSHLSSPTLRLPPTNMMFTRSDPIPTPSTPPPRLRRGPSPTPVSFPSMGPPSPNLQPFSPSHRLPLSNPGIPHSATPARHQATMPALPSVTKALAVPSSLPPESPLVPALATPTRKTSFSNISRRPLMNRQASVTVMETAKAQILNDAVASPEPVQTLKPTTGRSSSRGYRSEPETNGSTVSTIKAPKATPTMGLKEVLNLFPISPDTVSGGTGAGNDLLPPSPSRTHPRLHPHLQSPHPDVPPKLDVSPSAANGSFSGTDHNRTAINLPVILNIAGPSIRPLDYSVMLSSSDLHAELSRTVDDLGQWLSLVESGLSCLLLEAAEAGDDEVASDAIGINEIPEETEVVVQLSNERRRGDEIG